VVKDLAFLGWYENGKLVGDTHVCIGKKREWTKSGLHRVLAKDIRHVSSKYRSAYGYPSFMPYALRIYGQVWIHGGDVTGGNCSHGCINLPIEAAEKLYAWAKPGTIVMIVESAEELAPSLEKHAKAFGIAQGKR
jgi:lipoprotein-anchoring transpeptidase ErfK/SrfK